MQLRQSGLTSSRSNIGQCKPISGSCALKQLFLQCIISRPRAYILQTAEASCDACSGFCNKLPSQINKVLHDDFSYKPSKQPNAKSLSLYRSAYQSPLCFFAYFFLPFLPLVEPPAEVADATLEALDGVAELFLLDLTDLTLSSALF